MTMAPKSVPGRRPTSTHPMPLKSMACRSRCAIRSVSINAAARSGAGTNPGSMSTRSGAASMPRPNPTEP